MRGLFTEEASLPKSCWMPASGHLSVDQYSLP